MIQIRDTSAVKQWYYIDPDDGHSISCFGDFNAIANAVKIYRRANSYPLGSNWNEQLTAILCKHLPNACVDVQPPSLAQQASSLSRALFRWAKQGFPTRSDAEVQRILSICRECPQYGGENGFLKVICRKCKCSRKKIFLASENCPLPQPKW